MFAPLQGKTAKKILEPKYIDSLDTLVFYMNGETYIKSTALLKILKEIGGVWSIFYVLIIIPSFIRDFIYNGISKIRYSVFGKHEYCRIPKKNELDRFFE